ncbi:MAG: lytic murein transglycosylase B [Gammaproteobacteria bacterium]|nr:lytic murein transglycosylase B [Gammaproteobacteria bacterium]
MRIIILSLLLAVANTAIAFDQEQIDTFVDDVVARYDLDRSWVSSLLQQAERKQSILDAISRPAERTREWHEYRDLFVTDQRIAAGQRFWAEHEDTLATVAEECGVPAEIIVAILGVETQYGRQTGGYRVIDALSTLAFAYPPRSDFFRGELEQFLLMVQEHDVDPTSAKGSYAGAMGAAQFISSSYRNYAVDASGDGRIDLWRDWRDVIGSVANYLHTFGWRPDEPITYPVSIEPEQYEALKTERIELKWSAAELRARGIDIPVEVADDAEAMVMELITTDGPQHFVGLKNFYVITRYNHSRMYAMAVHDLGWQIANRRKMARLSD